MSKVISDRFRSFSGQENRKNQGKDNTKVKTVDDSASEKRTTRRGRRPQNTGKQRGKPTNTGTWSCKNCNDVAQDDECMMMECERCENHFCVDCIDMNTEVYKYMCKDEVIWCCAECTTQVRNLIEDESNNDATHTNASQHLEPAMTSMRKDLDDTISHMKEVMEAFHTFIASDGSHKQKPKTSKSTEEATTSSEDQVEGPWKTIKSDWKPLRQIMKETNEESRKEAEEEMARRKNVIIHHLPELRTDERDRRWEDDSNKVKMFMETLEIEIEVEKVARLGKRPESEEQPARPIKLMLKSEDDAKKIYSNLYKLKNKEQEWSKLRITPDRNEQERQKIKKLVEKAKNLTQLEEGDFVHIVRGAKILRVKRRGPKPAADAEQRK